MKKLTITLIVALIFCVQFANAQVNTSSAKSAATAASSSFDAVATAIQGLKEKAVAEFSTEQAVIDLEKTRLVGVRASIEKDNAAEKDMMADKWPARVAARQTLVQNEQAVTLKSQKLQNRVKAFEHKVAQLEQRANAAIAMESEHLTGRNQIMNNFAGSINATEY